MRKVNVGYGIGVGDYQVDRFHVETIHGVRVNPYFFAGVGVDFSLGSKLGLYVKLGYQSQGVKDNYNETLVMYGPSNTGAIVAQVGFRF